MYADARRAFGPIPTGPTRPCRLPGPITTVEPVFVNRQSPPHRSARRAVALLSLFAFAAAACSDDKNDAITTTSAASAVASSTTTDVETPLPMGDIVATALTAHVFTELAGLAVDAGLVDTLRGGPFTVFAPTDDRVRQAAARRAARGAGQPRHVEDGAAAPRGARHHHPRADGGR